MTSITGVNITNPGPDAGMRPDGPVTVQIETTPLAEARPDCPTHRTRNLLIEALDKALSQNVSYIDQLIEKLEGTKDRLVSDAQVVKNALSQHYDFAAEALAFADKVEERLLSIGKNGGNNNHDDRPDEEKEPPPTAPGPGPGRDDDGPEWRPDPGAFVARRGIGADVDEGWRELSSPGYRERL
jgi:hypothetical protein